MPKTDDQKKRDARRAAERALREAHAEEFRALLEAEHEARGVEYRPRLSEEEKAEQTVKDLLAQFPQIKDNL